MRSSNVSPFAPHTFSVGAPISLAESLLENIELSLQKEVLLDGDRLDAVPDQSPIILHASELSTFAKRRRQRTDVNISGMLSRDDQAGIRGHEISWGLIG